MPLVSIKEDDEETDFDRESNKSENDDHHKQDWSKVEPVAWVLLITISVECFIEGVAFSLTLQNAFGAGIAFLTAMLIKESIILSFIKETQFYLLAPTYEHKIDETL